MATHTVRAALFFGLFAVLAMSLPTEASRVKAARLSSNWSSTRAHHTSATTTALTSISPIEYVNSLGGSLGGVALSGPYMYLVEGGGLTVLDVGSAPAPVQIARLPLPAIGHRVQIVGARAYVSARDGLHIIDIGNPARPTLIGSFATAGDSRAVQVAGTRAYVTAEGVYSATLGTYVGKGLDIVDISTPSRPTLLGHYETPGYSFALEVVVANNRAYLNQADAYSSSMLILDVSNPAVPTVLGNYSSPGNDIAVRQVVGNLVYIAYAVSHAAGGGLQIVDVSNPAQPTLRGTLALSGTFDVQVVANLAYVTSDKVYILDVSNPHAPAVSGSYQPPGAPEYIAVAGGMAVLTLSDSRVQSLDVSAPTVPTPRGIYTTVGSPWALRVVGDLAYAIESPNGGPYYLRLLDVHDPAHPVLRGRIGVPRYSSDLDIAGGRAYVASGQDGLQIIDVTDPISPTLLGAYVRPDLSVDAVRVVGDRAYVACESQLLVLDVSDPRSPTFLGHYPMLLSNTKNMQVVDNLVYVAHVYGLDIFDVSDPTSPILRSGYHPTGGTYAVQVVGDRAYVSDRGSVDPAEGLRFHLDILDVSNPSNPVPIGYYRAPGIVTGVHIEGSLGYILAPGGMYVLDVSDPTNTRLRSSYPTPSYPNAMQVAGDLFYIAEIGNGDGGLEILRVHRERFFQTTATITAGGGTLTSYDGAVRVSFPAGAVSSTVTVTYTGLLVPTPPLESGRIAVHSFTLEARDADGQVVQQFSKPYTMVISYTDAQLAALGVDEGRLHLAFWNGGAWVDVLPCDGCRVDTAKNQVTTALDHFTEFMLAGGTDHRLFLPLLRR